MDEPGELGSIVYGTGAVLLPGPLVQEGWNPSIRDYADGVFRWRQVVGLEPTPDQGYQLSQADSYILEITPDLGWPNTEGMFEPWIDNGIGLGNARLKVISGIDSSNFIVANDQTVTYEVDEDTMKQILSPGYTKYLWRVRAMSSTGASGLPSDIQSFRGRVLIPATDWSVEPLPAVSAGMQATIHGTKSASISSIEINGSIYLVDISNNISWSAEVALVPGRNIFDIRAIDTQGNTSEYRRIETEVTAKDLEVFSYFNRFDDFGFLLDLPRIKGESNYDYRERIKDVMVHRASCLYPGLMNALLRELDLDYDDEAMYLAPAADEDTRLNYTDILCWIDTEGFKISSPRYQRRHVHATIDPNTRSTSLADFLPFSSVRVEQPLGVEVSSALYEVDHLGTIQFSSDIDIRLPVYVSYSYLISIDIADLTIAETIEAINDLTYEGRQQVIATAGSEIDTSLPASGLQRFRPTLLGLAQYLTVGEQPVENKYPVRWAEIELYPIMDAGFKARYLNSVGSRFGTRYDDWAMSLKSALHTTWGYLVADENVWSHPEIRVSGIGTLETIYDAPYASWRDSTSSRIYSPNLAELLNYRSPSDDSVLGYLGVPFSWLRSGIGHGNDLYVSLTESQGDIEQEVSEFREVVQRTANTDPDDADLGLGVVAVDSVNEVS